MPRRFPSAFLLPQLSLFVPFLLLPTLAVVAISLCEWQLLGQRRFIGLGNYAELLEDRDFWRALGNTFLFAAAIVPGTLLSGLVLALGLNREMAGRNAIRAAIYLPFVISGVASGVIGVWLFDEQYGLINQLLERSGLPRLPWLSSRHLAMPTLAGTTIWLRSGLCMVIYLAALQDVPSEQLDAAALDGAGPWSRFRYVTWPALRPSTTFLVITNLIYSLQVFDLVFVMTAGGPAGSTNVLVNYLYQAAFEEGRQGYGAAVGVLLLIMLLLLAGLLNWRRWRDA